MQLDAIELFGLHRRASAADGVRLPRRVEAEAAASLNLFEVSRRSPGAASTSAVRAAAFVTPRRAAALGIVSVVGPLSTTLPVDVVVTLIFADWIPPDFCASRSCLTLATDISADADALN
jgi:hypothetical protein